MREKQDLNGTRSAICGADFSPCKPLQRLGHGGWRHRRVVRKLRTRLLRPLDKPHVPALDGDHDARRLMRFFRKANRNQLFELLRPPRQEFANGFGY